LAPVITGIAIDPNDAEHVYISFTGYYEGYKVWETTDGGFTWSTADPAITLYNLPVNDIVIQDGTSSTPGNSRVFIATDAGVYYKNVNETCWKRYGDIPNVRVQELVLKTCTNELFAATYGRGVWKADLPELTMPLSAIIIDEDMTFDEDKFFYNSLRVTDNATLTITADVYMPALASIVVEPGSELILDGGRLTSACGEMWQGIEVHGNTGMSQSVSNQGVLITKNGAVIENAREAISFIEPGNWGSRGGIAWCKDTKFINNKRSAQFMAYSDPNNSNLDYKSYFIKCDFIFNDDNLLTSSEPAPKAQVTLWGVKGVKFLGCTFENTANVSQFEERSKGIFSIDASYRINSYCDVTVQVGGTCPTASYTKSSFAGYHIGVHPESAAGVAAPSIRQTEFDLNMLGIHLDEASFSKVVDNQFTVGNHPFDTPEPFVDEAIYNTGVLTTGLTNFSIEENQFFGDNTETEFTHGVVVQEGEGALVSIYNNKMTSLGSGAIGSGINADDLGQGESGLRFICNENTSNKTDMEVREIGGEDYGYIDDTQTGIQNTQQSSGNILSAADGMNGNFVHMDFQSDKSYTYRYDDSFANQIPNEDEVNIEPPFPDGNIELSVGVFDNTCPSNYSSGPVKGDYYSLKSEFYNLLYTYHQFIDKGNTEGTLNDVALAWPTNAWDFRDTLIARSPNNSDTVLIAAINKNILPHGMLLEVSVLNPDALLNDKVIDHLKCCMVDPMPQYMIDIIEASKHVPTARTLLEHNLSNLRHGMAVKHRLIVDEMLRDSTGTHPDTLVEWLGDMRHIEGRYNLVSHYLGRGDYAMARATMDSLQSQIQLGGIKTKELNKMRQFTTFLENIHGQGKNIAQLDSVQVDYLITMANNPESGTAGARAENILCFFYEICSPPAPSPKSNIVSPRKPKPNLEELIKAQNTVAISPNPADQYVQLEYELLFSKQNTVMNIYDQLGRKVSSYTIGTNTQGVEILDTRKLVAGLYIVEIVQEGKQVFSDKFIVQH
jgi:hypothetical protein